MKIHYLFISAMHRLRNYFPSGEAQVHVKKTEDFCYLNWRLCRQSTKRWPH